MSREPRPFTVYTYCKTGETRKSKVHCYTRWCPPHWPGGLVVEVVATSGAEAKKLAQVLRIQHEAKDPQSIAEGGGT